MPAVDADDPSTIVIFTSRLFGNNNSAAFLQRSTVPFSFAAAFNDDGDGSRDLIIDSQSSGDTQGLLGFGGAFTDAAADALASVSRPLQAQLLRQYFGPDGLGYRLGRVPIGGTDFSAAPYSYDDDAPGDLSLRNFSVAMDEPRKLPLLRAALALEPRLELVGSPWSAPAWMKDSGSLVWGALRGEPGGDYYRAWAAYLCRFLSEYAARGVRMRWLTVQNEPTFSLVTRFSVRWNAMALTPERTRDFIKRDLGPALAAHHPGAPSGGRCPPPCWRTAPHQPAWFLLGLGPLLRIPERRPGILGACRGLQELASGRPKVEDFPLSPPQACGCSCMTTSGRSWCAWRGR